MQVLYFAVLLFDLGLVHLLQSELVHVLHSFGLGSFVLVELLHLACFVELIGILQDQPLFVHILVDRVVGLGVLVSPSDLDVCLLLEPPGLPHPQQLQLAQVKQVVGQTTIYHCPLFSPNQSLQYQVVAIQTPPAEISKNIDRRSRFG